MPPCPAFPPRRPRRGSSPTARRPRALGPCALALVALFGASLRADPPPTGLEPDRVRPGRSIYRLLFQGVPVGLATFEVREIGSDLELRERSVVAVAGIDAERLTVIDRSTLLPRSYRASGTLFGKPLDIQLDWSEGRVRGYAEVAQPGAAPGRQAVDREVGEALEHRALLFLAPALVLGEGEVWESEWFDSHSGEVRPVTARALGVQTTAVPAGRFETVQVLFESGAPEHRLFLSAAPPRTLIKIETLGANPESPAWVYERVLGLDLRESVATSPRQPEGTKLVYLVRHAEKVGDGSRDPALTEAGQQRARDLAAALRYSGIRRIYSTDLARTRDTAAPVAAALGIEVELYDPRQLDHLAQLLKDRPGSALVVGHSNTTPDLVAWLGGDPGGPIDESDYTRLYVVTLSPPQAALTILLQFGATAP